MNRSFKPRLVMMDERLMPATLALTATVIVEPPPPATGALVAQADTAADGGSTVIICDDLVVKGQRPTRSR
jgi:hypothetical protein